jgi:hypothetical protein
LRTIFFDSPRYRMAIAQEIAGEILRRFGRQPHDRVGAFLD